MKLSFEGIALPRASRLSKDIQAAKAETGHLA